MNELLSGSERTFRRRLGIPDEAREVLIFTESSHWDPDWMKTSEEYYTDFVQSNLDEAVLALEKDSRRVYSVECIFFLRMYWERNPEKQERLRTLINSGRMRLTGSGVTTADTLLPDSEGIFRDFLVGQEWLRKNGLNQEPDLAYFTDSFGCTPALPSLLNAAGFTRTAITRVDGMFFFACDLESSKNFPRKDSSAERLLKEERSLDFIWRDNNGAEVLCHWNAFSYGQGDMLAHGGIGRIYLAHMAVPMRSGRHIARRVKHYTGQLRPYSRTPYMCCPIGFDFVEPIRDLVSLLESYNRKYYPVTGVWTVNAGLDDYLALVDFHRDRLPVMNLDPNPYWTGFYSARPVLKKQCRNLTDKLLQAENLSFLPGNQGNQGNQEAGKTLSDKLEEPWWTAVVSNHHDFITGTSPDRVVEEEQIPWLEKAAEITGDILAGMKPADREPESGPAPESGDLSWLRKDGRIIILTPYYEAEFSETEGGGVTGLRTRSHGGDKGSILLRGISNNLLSYKDAGGLWRMGMEFAGGKWKESERADSRHTAVEVKESGDELEVSSRVDLNGETFIRRLRFSASSPEIRCRVEGMAAEGYSVILRLRTGLHPGKLSMDTPGGMVYRPLQRFYNPTFWPLHRFVHVADNENGRGIGRGIAIIQALPGAVFCGENGDINLVAMRNATKETVLGFLGIPGNPASGHEREKYVFEYSLLFTGAGDWKENGIHRRIPHPLNSPVVTADSPDVYTAAVKPAYRGEGVIVRLSALCPPESPVTLESAVLKFTRAFLCDTRERDIEALKVKKGRVKFEMAGTSATLRLLE